MKEDLLKILSQSNKDIDNQQLMDYLQGKLSAGESHELEKKMADDALFNDAIEGLQNIRNKKDIQTYVEQMNRDLQKNLTKKRRRREKRRWKDNPWGYVAVIVIILACLAWYFIVTKMMATTH